MLAASTKWMPQLYDQVMPYLSASAQGAALQCAGPATSCQGVANACGFEWNLTTWDGTCGVGQQMSALEVIQSQLISPSRSPVTKNTGGISKGDPSLGTSGDYGSGALPPTTFGAITTASKAGAGILTAVVLLGWLGLVWWII